MQHAGTLSTVQRVAGAAGPGAGAHRHSGVQIDPVKYKSISEGFKLTVREAGYGGLFRGWFPTLIGYSVQGAGKFGLYEYFKK